MGVLHTSQHVQLAVNNVILSFHEKELKVLLIKRLDEPFANMWELPGSYMLESETLEDTAIRVLEEKVGITSAFLNQLGMYSAIKRDPRGRVVAACFIVLVKYDKAENPDGQHTAWFNHNELPDMAFDHNRVIKDAFEELKNKFRFQPIGFEMLPEDFTLTQLQRLYESVLQQPLDKRNFRKKILNLELLKQTGKQGNEMEKRAATLYKFDKTKYVDLKKKGKKFTLY